MALLDRQVQRIALRREHRRSHGRRGEVCVAVHWGGDVQREIADLCVRLPTVVPQDTMFHNRPFDGVSWTAGVVVWPRRWGSWFKIYCAQDYSFVESSEVEKILYEILKDILKVNDFKITSDLFAVGMDSLNAIVFINTIYKRFDVKMMISDLYDNLTIQKIASKVNSKILSIS